MKPLTAIRKSIAEITLGKRLPEHVYIHISGIAKLPEASRLMVAQALLVAGEFQFELIKVAKDGLSVSLLHYPDFDTKAHPALIYSVKVHFPHMNFVFTNYKKSGNPPILHRKETCVDASYPHYQKFVKLTKMEEDYHLLGRRDIGNKKQWENLLSEKHLSIKGHSIREI
jgi:DNA phosphorothioation-associated putative methyltransferase